MNDTAGAASIEARGKYPQAPAIMHPTSRPRTTAHDFMIGEPKRSHRMIVTKTENPRPMNSALPHGRGLGAKIVGHNLNIPVVGRV